MATGQRSPRRAIYIAAIAVVLAAIVIGIAVAVGVVTSRHADPAGASTTAVDGDASGATDPTLSLSAAKAVFDAHEQAKASGDAEMFEQSTCREFINADIEQRGQGSVQELLSAYERARRFVPVQIIDNPTVIHASSRGTSGTIEVAATVTDNRFVPPTTEDRTITWDMSYEEGRWKFCPSIDPV